MIYDNKEQLQAACVKWQGVLRLRDWVVDARIVRSAEISGKAEVEYDIAEKVAVVKLLDPADYDRAEPQNHEVSLVHELLHLSCSPLDPLIKNNPLADVVLEQIIRPTATALVQMMDAIRVQATQSEAVTTDKQDDTSSIVEEHRPDMV